MSFAWSVFYYFAKCLEGILFGIYSGLFAIHWHLACHATKKDNSPNIIFYALCVLYVFTGAVFATNIVPVVDDNTLLYSLDISSTILFSCCDFIAQCILIHRCWIVCGRNIHVIIIPSTLAFANLVMWVASNGAYFIAQNGVNETVWGVRLALTSLITSMTVNALVTGIIVFRIFRVFREVKSVRVTGGTKLHSITFIIIESGMALFAIQLARVVITPSLPVLGLRAAGFHALEFIVAIHQMVNGIAPTIILVRVSLGLSFHDEESLVEAVSSLQFGANPIPEAGSIYQDRSAHIGHDEDLNPLPVMGNINQEER